MESKSLADITQRGIKVLLRELGPVDAVRFLNQYSTGHGDYTADRDRLFGEMTLDQIFADIVGPARRGEDQPAAS